MCVQSADLGLHTHSRVRICKETLDTNENFGDCERQAPVVVDGVETDVAMTTDVGMEDLADEANDRRTHGVTTKQQQKADNVDLQHNSL